LTAFWCKMPSQHIQIALDVLTDMMKNPLFDEKELEKERKVIFEEIRMYKDNPRMHVFDEIQKALYDGTMDISLSGNDETMNSINREKMVAKFKEVYTPNNMILAVVGNANFEELCAFAEKNFENNNKEIKTQEFGLKNESRVEERTGIDQANLVFAFHVPLCDDKKSYAAKVLSVLMCEGMSSRLFAEIREKRNLAYAVKGGAEVNKDFAYNFIYVGTEKQNVEKVKELILNEFEKVVNELEEKEVQEIKDQMISNYHISMEESQMQMVNLLYSEVHGDAKNFYEYEKNISEVKLEDVRELAAKVKEGYSFFALVPSEK